MTITSSYVHTAKHFAIRVHSGQTYGDEFPYSIHLQAVESALLRFGIGSDIQSQELLAAGWLHDVLEDTKVTYEDLSTLFNPQVADLVAAVTEPKGGNRAWRHKETYPRIKTCLNAILIKLADRIANVEAGGRKVGMYRKEHTEFKNELISSLVHQDYTLMAKSMWAHLDSLIAELVAAEVTDA